MKIWLVIICMMYMMTTRNVMSIYTAKESSRIFNSINKMEYQKFVPPPTKDMKPVDVSVLLVFHELLPLRPRYYRISLDLVMKWNDTRMVFTSPNNRENILPIGQDIEGLLWIPDIVIVDESAGKEGYKPIQRAHVHQNGMVEYSRRLSLEMFCPMNYWLFPFDKQKCEITFQSYGYSTKQMRLHWPSNVQSKNQIVDFQQFFEATEYILFKHNISQRKVKLGRAGEYDVLVVTLNLKRNANYYMSQHLLPLNLNIILSMTTFWIDHKCVKARITIPLVVVLTLTKQTAALKATFPFQRTPVSMEYYLNFSIFFVFMVLLEYCSIGLYKIHLIKKDEKEIQKRTTSFKLVDDIENHRHPEFRKKQSFRSYLVNEPDNNKAESVVHPLDSKARYVYPLFFIFYNALYFSLLITNQGFNAF